MVCRRSLKCGSSDQRRAGGRFPWTPSSISTGSMLADMWSARSVPRRISGASILQRVWSSTASRRLAWAHSQHQVGTPPKHFSSEMSSLLIAPSQPKPQNLTPKPSLFAVDQPKMELGSVRIELVCSRAAVAAVQCHVLLMCCMCN